MTVDIEIPMESIKILQEQISELGKSQATTSRIDLISVS